MRKLEGLPANFHSTRMTRMVEEVRGKKFMNVCMWKSMCKRLTNDVSRCCKDW